jgi:hypothetical protein
MIGALRPNVFSGSWPKRIPEIAAAIPALIFFAFVVSYGVNVPNWDDFNLIPLLDKLQHGHLTFADVWAQHNENRVFFPNVLWFAAALLVRDDLKIVMIFDALVMIASGVLLYRTWRRSGGDAWLAVPASFLYFTLLQHENALSAFQLSWYLVALGFAIVAYMLDCERPSRTRLAIALAAAIVASFSSLQGLFCWPAGVVFLLNHGDRKSLLAWLGCGALATVAYFVGFDFAHTGDVGLTNSLLHPGADVAFAIVSLGGLITGNSPANPAVVLLAGVFGFAFLGCALVATGVAVSERPALPIKRLPFAMLVFAGLFLVAIGLGRGADPTFQGALASRYTLFTAYVPIATVLLFASVRSERNVALDFAIGAFGMLVAIAIVAGLSIGTSIGRYAVGERTRDIVRFTKARSQSDEELKHLWCCPSLIRDAASLAERDRLMTFAHATTAR